MVVWEIRFERRACKDASRLKAAGLKERADKILELIQEDPYYSPPPFEKLIGDLVVQSENPDTVSQVIAASCRTR
jgi:toxin YoeB